MNILIKDFDKIISSPNGITKARELILLLAIQGKLTEKWRKDNPDIEPASELLKKIKAEKEKLIKEGKIRKQKESIPLDLDDIVNELPNTWTINKIGSIFITTSGGTPSRARSEYWNGSINWLKSGELNDNKNISSTGEFITEIGLKNSSAKIFEKDSVVLALYGATAGKVGILGIETATNQAVCNFRKTKFVNSEYLFYFLLSLRSKILKECFGGAQPNISQEYVKQLTFLLPPLHEQKQIVEKVNNMMSFLDEIEEKQNRLNDKKIKLNNSSLDKLVKSEDSKEFKLNWNRITQNFEKLYSVPENVDKLKQTILQLAVQGKLTEQWRKENPNVEPASELLKKIKAEKQKLLKEGKIKKQKELPQIMEDEKQFVLPDTWAWTTLYEIGLVNPRNDIKDELEVSFIPMKNISEFFGETPISETRTWGEIKKGFTHFAENDIGLAKITPCFENGKAAIFTGLINGFGAGTTELHIFRPLTNNICPEFIYTFIKSPEFVLRGSKLMTGSAGQKRVSKDYFGNTVFGLPSFDEQKQIVKNVNSLMNVCNKLEKKIKLKTEEQEKLVEAVVSTAINNNLN